MATFGRGRHILPSVNSVLAQTEGDYELLVVGDHCTDETEVALAPLLSNKVRWLNLPTRGGGQSFPNNAGIQMARGKFIAYLGHDDIWAPEHLALLKRRFDETDAHFAISGGALHMPPGVDQPRVTGLFAEPGAALEHFFPPSTLAHRRDVVDQIGPWRDPFSIVAPVDIDFQLRAARLGMSFVSTGRITVHKFTATHRYLSYLVQSSVEQQEMLDRLIAGEAETIAQQAIARSKEVARYMTLRIPSYEGQGPGDEHRKNIALKGSTPVAADELRGIEALAPGPGNYVFDWAKKPVDGILWSGPSLLPKFQIPFTTQRRAVVTMCLFHRDQSALTKIRPGGPFASNVRVSTPAKAGDCWLAAASFDMDLRATYGGVVTFDIRESRSSVGLGTIIVQPAVGERAQHRIRGLRRRVKTLRAEISAIRSSSLFRARRWLHRRLGI
jgi:hypothetical protein